MAGPDKPEDDSPKTDKDASFSGDSTPEQVEAEIVDSEGDGAAAEDVIASETISENESASPAQEKPAGVMSPGIVLLGLMALVLVGVMLSRGGGDDSATGGQLASGAADREENVTSDDLLATAENAGETVQEAVAEEAGQVARDAEDIASRVAPDLSGKEPEAAATSGNEDTGKLLREAENEAVSATDGTGARTATDDGAVEASSSGDETVTPAVNEAAATPDASTMSAAERLEQRRRAVIERARARLDAKAAEAEEKKEADKAEAETIIAAAADEGTIAEDPADAGKGSVASDAPETATASVDTADASETPSPEAAGAEQAAVSVDPQKAPVTEEKLTNELANLKSEVKADVLAAAQAAMDADKQQLQRQEQQIASLEARLDKLQNSGIASAGKQAAVSVALNNLQRQIDAGRPFAGELQTLSDLVPSLRANGIEDYAEGGMPTMAELRDNYAEVVRKALAATKRESADGPVGGIAARFAGLFSVRQIGQVEGDSPSAIMARAEDNLEKDNLAQALRELDSLEGAPAEMFSPWMEDARARISAEELIDNVTNRLLSELR